MDTARPSSLFPDGCFSERHRSLAYLDRGNADGFHGVLSFWVKPAYTFVDQPARGHVYVDWTNGTTDPFGGHGELDQLFFLSHMNNAHWGTPSSIQVWFKPGTSGVEEYSFQTDTHVVIPRRWFLCSFYYDFAAPVAPVSDQAGELVIDDGSGGLNAEGLFGPNRGSGTSYWEGGTDPSWAADITLDAVECVGGIVQPHRIVLGRRNLVPWNALYAQVLPLIGTGADVTFDEFAIYDLGQDPVAADVMIQTRFRDGRYYRESRYEGGLGTPPSTQDADGFLRRAAEYCSAPIRLPAGSRIRTLAWTWRRPAGLPDDYAEIALANPDATGYAGPEARSRSVRGQGWTADLQRWDPRMAPEAAFRIQVVFRRVTPLAPEMPVLDSPVLDDLTLICQPGGAAALADWREGE